MNKKKYSKLSVFPIYIALFLIITPQLALSFNMGYHFDLTREAMVSVGFDSNSDAVKLALAGNGYTEYV